MQTQLLHVGGLDGGGERPVEAVPAHRILQAAERLSAQPGAPTWSVAVNRQGPARRPDDPDQLVGWQGSPAADTGPCRCYVSASSDAPAAATGSAPAAPAAVASASAAFGSASAAVGSASAAFGSASADASAAPSDCTASVAGGSPGALAWCGH